MGCCSLAFLVLPAFIHLGGICSESSLHLQLPSGALSEGRGRVESSPASVVVKGKLNIPGSRTGEKDVRKIMQISSEVFSCSVLESSFCARYGDLDLS